MNVRCRHLLKIFTYKLLKSSANFSSFLNLIGCKNLENLPSDICELKYLTTLHCNYCTKLKIFPEINKDMERLRELNLMCTSIQELPSSVERLKGLEDLSLLDCESLVSLPDSICNLTSLKTLDLLFCRKLKKLPENLGRLQCLKKFYAMGGNHFSWLPAGISQLSKLRVLGLGHCNMLQEIPELPSSLRDIEVHDCASLETLSSPPLLPWKRQLWCSFLNCFKSEVKV